MPTEQPSNAPDALTPKDDASAAAMLADDRLDTTPGGGGLGGASAADPLASTAGAGAPDTPFADGAAMPGKAEREAQRQSAETTPSTGGRSSGG